MLNKQKEMEFELEKLDISENFNLASKAGAVSVPALIFEEKLVFSGDLSESKVRDELTNFLS